MPNHRKMTRHIHSGTIRTSALSRIYRSYLCIPICSRLRASLPFALTGCDLKGEGETMTAAVTWNSVAGKQYVVEYNDDLLGDWEIVSPAITAATSTSGTETNPVPRSQRGFFRVRELEP